MKRIRRFYKGGNWTYIQCRRVWKQGKKYKLKRGEKCQRFKSWVKDFADYLKSLNSGKDYTE